MSSTGQTKVTLALGTRVGSASGTASDVLATFYGSKGHAGPMKLPRQKLVPGGLQVFHMKIGNIGSYSALQLTLDNKGDMWGLSNGSIMVQRPPNRKTHKRIKVSRRDRGTPPIAVAAVPSSRAHPTPQLPDRHCCEYSVNQWNWARSMLALPLCVALQPPVAKEDAANRARRQRPQRCHVRRLRQLRRDRSQHRHHESRQLPDCERPVRRLPHR